MLSLFVGVKKKLDHVDVAVGCTYLWQPCVNCVSVGHMNFVFLLVALLFVFQTFRDDCLVCFYQWVDSNLFTNQCYRHCWLSINWFCVVLVH